MVNGNIAEDGAYDYAEGPTEINVPRVAYTTVESAKAAGRVAPRTVISGPTNGDLESNYMKPAALGGAAGGLLASAGVLAAQSPGLLDALQVYDGEVSGYAAVAALVLGAGAVIGAGIGGLTGRVFEKRENTKRMYAPSGIDL
mgnify:FL=1